MFIVYGFKIIGLVLKRLLPFLYQVGEQSGNHQHMDRDDEPEESETGHNTIITQREIESEKSKEPLDIINPEGANPSTTQNIIDNIASLRQEAIAGFIPIFKANNLTAI